MILNQLSLVLDHSLSRQGRGHLDDLPPRNFTVVPLFRSTIRVSFCEVNLGPGLARVGHFHRHWHVVVLRGAWLWHRHKVLLVDVLGHLRMRR